jgi:hypothetical protein
VAGYVREQPDGTAQSGAQAFEDFITDVNSIGRLVAPDRPAVTMASFNGTLSDHNTTEKKQNDEMKKKRNAEISTIDIQYLSMFCWNHK